MGDELRFDKETDVEHVEVLDSHLISAYWWSKTASVGSRVKVQVETSMVGEGAPIKIVGKDTDGKSFAEAEGTVSGNSYTDELEIPYDLKVGDRVSFEVDLPGNDASGISNVIPVVSSINVENLKWDMDIARRGDIVKMTANVKGAQDGAEATITIFEYDRDSVRDKIVTLKTNVKNGKIDLDWNYEYHEDTDEIPTEDEMQQYGQHYNPPEYFFTVTIAGQEFGNQQESGLLRFNDTIEIELVREDGSPFPDERYVIILPDGSEREGHLDELGRTFEENIPPGVIDIRFPDIQREQSRESNGN